MVNLIEAEWVSTSDKRVLGKCLKTTFSMESFDLYCCSVLGFGLLKWFKFSTLFDISLTPTTPPVSKCEHLLDPFLPPHTLTLLMDSPNLSLS